MRPRPSESAAKEVERMHSGISTTLRNLFVGAALLSAAWAEEPRRAFLWGLRIAFVGGLALGALTLVS